MFDRLGGEGVVPGRPAPRSDRGRPPDLGRSALRLLGELLITAGLLILLFALYELKVTDIRAGAAQDDLRQELQQAWRDTPPPDGGGTSTPRIAPASGQPFAVLRIPQLGADYSRVVVEGVGTEDLKKGPGHYPGTAFPGQVGNVVISGHRTTYGSPFGRLDELRPGSPITLTERLRVYTYRVTGIRIVSPEAREVLLPVPYAPNAAPVKPLLTLTTCHPKYSARQRLIVFAELAS